MNFRNWCFKAFGITEIGEGKILDCVFIPGIPNKNIILLPFFLQAGGYVMSVAKQQGLVLSVASFTRFETMFNSVVSGNTFLKGTQFKMADYFLLLNMDFSKNLEYKEASPVHLTFTDVESRGIFLNQFREYPCMPSFNVLSMKHTVLFEAGILKKLWAMYYHAPPYGIKKNLPISSMHQQVTTLNYLKEQIHRKWMPHLQSLYFLAKDFSLNVGTGLYFSLPSAVSTYAFSLKLFAEINKDSLSVAHYKSLLYASSLLVSPAKNKHMRFSLKKDAQFVMDLCDLYKASINKKNTATVPYRAKSFSPVGPDLEAIIDYNARAMLYGGWYLPLNKRSPFNIPRFFPDAYGHSDTDEIIFQSGGSKHHSAILRIIKVGFLESGLRAPLKEPAHFYRYYRVLDNLGEGCNSRESYYKTCISSHITHLKPMGFIKGLWVPLDLDPMINAEAYQDAMKTTMLQLIKTDRLLMCYRLSASVSDEHYVPEGSAESLEWHRLNRLRILLSGSPYLDRLHYYSYDPFNMRTGHERALSAQRQYYQEGGSCTIFSLKSLVFSMLDRELAVLHNHFIQNATALSHVESINEKIALLNQSSDKVTRKKQIQKTQQTHGFFSYRNPTLLRGNKSDECTSSEVSAPCTEQIIHKC